MNRAPVEGVKEALQVIKRFDKTLAKHFTREFKQAVDPTVKAAQRRLPGAAPLSGMERNWRGQPLWRGGSTERRQITAKIDTSRSKRLRASQIMYETVGVVSVIGGSGKVKRGRVSPGRNISVLDMAGRKGSPSTPQGKRLIDKLNQELGDASRFMWPAADETLDDVTRNCVGIVHQAEVEANRILERHTAGGVL